MAGARGPYLLPVDHVVVALLNRPGLVLGRIRTGGRLTDLGRRRANSELPSPRATITGSPRTSPLLKRTANRGLADLALFTAM